MRRNRMVALLLGAATLCLTAGSLSAAEVRGSFTLPTETQWGSTVLPAAHYTFTMDRAAFGGQILLSQSTRGVAFLMPQDISQTISAGPSSILIEGGRVRSMYLAPLGITYNYRIPRERNKMLARNSAPSRVTVAISTR